MNRKLLPLALGGLAIGTTEFSMMGLLPFIATATGHYLKAIDRLKKVIVV